MKIQRMFGAALLLAVLSQVALATQIVDRLASGAGAVPYVSGSLRISWPTYTNGSGHTVPQGQITVPVSNGFVNVSLQPYAGYTVVYVLPPAQSYTEYWAVPNSSTPLTIGQVRTSAIPTPNLSIALAQLAKGSALDGQCLAWSDAAGSYVPTPCAAGGSNATQIQGVPVVTSALTDGQLLKYNGTSHQWEPITLVDQETPAGTLDGTNVVFTLTNTPAPTNGLVLFRNGIVQKAGGFDYTLSGNTITFVDGATPQPGDTLLAWYRY